MRWGIFGPLLVADDADNEIVVPAGRLRVLLAALLTRANHLVPLDELVEILWNGTPPAGAARTVRVYIVRLRRALGPTASARIITQNPGYRCRAAADELDLLRFRELCAQARSAIREQTWSRAVELLTEALDLWRGPPLADVPSAVLRDRELPRLDQLRIQAVEERIDAELHLGRHEHLVPQLRDLIAQYPLREQLHAQLMRALARTGRRAEALDAYQQARRMLVDQLGIEPGPELRDVHRSVLAGQPEPGTAPAGATESGPAAAFVVPRQLPAAIRHFVGRVHELGALSGLLEQSSRTGGTVVISAIDGMAGIGKTALAVHWAHQHADQFPDGQLYANLHGFGPAGSPAPVGAILRRFLDALGISPAAVPADLDAQIDLYRSRVAGKRMLIVLDNARDAEQVRPLLPGAAGCLVLVTSRSQLAGLVAIDGAIPLPLNPFTDVEAVDLLRRRLGVTRISAREREVGELIELCDHLPLALNIAAARATLSPDTRLAAVVDELRDTRRRLDALSVGDSAADLRAVFSWSYRTLTARATLLFRLLGLHPGPDISVAAGASLAGVPHDQARQALDELVAAHLLAEPIPGRFVFHDLLRAYAAGRADADLPDQERNAALARLVGHYLHTAYAGDRLLDPPRDQIELAPPDPGCLPESPADAGTALHWFTAEHANLLAVQQLCAGAGRYTPVWQLAWALDTVHYRRGHLHDRVSCWEAGLVAAGHLGEPDILALANRQLGYAYARAGRYTAAQDHLHRARVFAEHTGDTLNQICINAGLAWVSEQQDDYREALVHGTSALQLAEAAGNSKWQAYGLNSVGWYHAHLEHYEQARVACESALTLARRQRNPECAAYALDSLGYIAHHVGHHTQALDYYQQALTQYRDLGDTYNEADTANRLGDVYLTCGRHAEARDAWRQALDFYFSQHRATDAHTVRAKLHDLDVRENA